MKKRLLGNTGIELSELGFGCAALWGKDALGKPAISYEKAYEIFETAIKAGVTFFDTGINYGYSEERLGKCIADAIGGGITSRSELVIETKCGETVNADGTYGPVNWSPDNIKRNVEISLKRLKTDYIDLLATHGGGGPDTCTDELLTTFESLKHQGIIKAYGANTFQVESLEWIAQEKCFDYVMPDYNIMRQEREPLIEKLTDAGVAVIAGSALGESLYSKKIFRVKSRNDLWYLARAIVRFRDLMSKSKDFRFLTKQKDYSANQLALRYVLDNPKISSAVFSTTSVEHLAENLKATEIVMPEQIRNEIKARHKQMQTEEVYE